MAQHEDKTTNFNINEELGGILNSINEGITVQKKTGEVVYANHSALKSLGLETSDQITNLSLQDLHKRYLHVYQLFNEDGEPLQIDQLPGRQVFRGVENPTLRIKYLNTETGKHHWSEVTAYPIYDENKEIKYAVNVFSGITRRKHTEQLLRFKAEVAQIFTTSTDFTQTLTKISELAVEYIADWSAIEMIGEKGDIELFSFSHSNPANNHLGKKLREINPTLLTNEHGSGMVIRTGKPELVQTVTDEDLKNGAKSDEHYQVLKDLGLCSSMIIPLNVRGKTIGAITFAYADSHYQYNNRDLEMAIILGLRASLAIENSLLYDEIELERQRLDDIVQNVPGIVWEWWIKENPSKAHQNYASAYIEKLLGYSQDEWRDINQLWQQIIHPDDLEKTTQVFEEIFTSSKSGSLTFRCIKKNNQVIWVETHCMVIESDNGTPIGLRGVIFDISERAEMEDRKTEFISLASHELKTPLSSLVVYVKLLEQQLGKNNGEKYLKYVDRISRQTKNLTNLVNDLLDISRIETGKMQLAIQPTTMSETVQEIVDTFQETTETHEITVEGESHRKVYVDKERISQVLLNLLSNAIKYSPGADSVIVKVKEEDSQVHVSVQDFGIGIEKESQSLIFNRFYRGTNESGKNFPGLGIGLYISHDIIQKHNGKFTLESMPGKGSTFTFSLPL